MFCSSTKTSKRERDLGENNVSSSGRGDLPNRNRMWLNQQVPYMKRFNYRGVALFVAKTLRKNQNLKSDE